ncbi:MAG: DUF4012 domain-containing protein, partial [Candidatus Magasanikbacteria bacterium]|nr:DUF4012 domain-containing protein [Candidatus Magasanikbacteria bacterium]
PFSLSAWQKALAGFALLAFLLILPLKVFSAYATIKESQKNILLSGASAFEYLNQGEKALQEGNIALTVKNIQISLNLFSEAQNELKQISPFWRSLLYLTPKIGNELKNGEELMLAGTNLTLGVLPLLYLFNDGQSSPSLNSLKQTLQETTSRFNKTNENLMAVDADFLPAVNRDAFLKIRETVFWLTSDLKKFDSLLQSLSQALGEKEEKNYLIIFQNEGELRPTGGFIGSFAELKIKNGRIAKLEVPGEGSYALQGSLKAALIPPAPLQLLQPRWQFQDANWFPDFPASAKKLMWFYEKSNGPTMDGVLAFDTYPLIDLLKITGPMALPNYQKTVNAENFVEEIQKQVEIEYDKTQNKPKQILADLAPLFLEKINKEKNTWLPLLALFHRNLNQRHIQFYFSDPELEKGIVAQGWGGAIKENAGGDYLAVINTNIGGGKSDRVIKQTIRHQSEIKDDGTVLDRVIVTREHQGRLDDVFANWQNVDFIRFYVPAGSQLIEAAGFSWPEEKHFKVPEKWYKMDEDLSRLEKNTTIDNRNGTVITEEFGKTVFGNWVLTKPGQSSTVSLTYRLPFKIQGPKQKGWLDWSKISDGKKEYSSYTLLVQKQAGREADAFIHDLSWPKDWQLLWTEPNNLLWQNNQLIFSANLSEDKFLGFLFQKNKRP